MLKTYPFGIGVGERAWRAVYPHFAISGTKTVMHAHNVFLQVATELGFWGVVVFFLWICLSILRAVQERNVVPVLAISGALVMGLFDHLWYYPGMLVPFCAMMALCTPQIGKVTKKEHFVDILHEN